MPLILNQRDTKSRERMDDPNCDLAELRNTYRQFGSVNRWIGRWQSIYGRYIAPLAASKDKTTTLLDIGFGGGDIPIALARWAERDRLDIAITAIDPDPRAYDFVRSLEHVGRVSFQNIGSSRLVEEGQKFDIVISNHLLHHLDREEFHQLLEESKKLSNERVLFNDIERSDLGYLLFNLLSRPLFRSSFITHDGLTSIRRSYTLEELREAAPADWKVERLFPYRVLLRYDHGQN